MSQVLIVDNEEKLVKVIKASLELEDLQAFTCTSGEAALEFLQQQSVEVVVSDMRMDGMSGLELLDQIKQRFPAIEVMIMTAYASQKTAIEALKKGACDYLIKPFEMDELHLRIQRILEQQRVVAENKRLRSKSEAAPEFFERIIGKSQKMTGIYRLIRKSSGNDTTVLLRGESGTGKDLVAQAIHEASARADRICVTVNCAALPENLLESELFGYEKGAFTGAVQRRIGKFEQANRGTVFLDEIGDMSLSTQAKMLRVLQNREIYRLGGNERIEIDVRIIAATHQHLEEMVAAGSFREDLYYRLNVFPIVLPPLRDRKEDIPALIHHFVALAGASGIDRAALVKMIDYDWPGNVRELRNAIERAAIISNGIISADDLPGHIGQPAAQAVAGRNDAFLLPENGLKLDELEADLIRQALRQAQGNKTNAAELLGITRRRLYSMMERFGIS